MDSNKKITILLLTNRDSDNVGDQVIEASDIGLLHALNLTKVHTRLTAELHRLLQRSIWQPKIRNY